MPVPFVEECEDLLEGLVGDMDVGMVFFYLVFGEDAAVEIGNVFADDGGQFVRAGLGIKAVVEQPLEKGDIKGVELVLPRVERTVLKRWMR